MPDTTDKLLPDEIIEKVAKKDALIKAIIDSSSAPKIMASQDLRLYVYQPDENGFYRAELVYWIEDPQHPFYQMRQAYEGLSRDEGRAIAFCFEQAAADLQRRT